MLVVQRLEFGKGTEVKEIRLERDKDGGNMFNGTMKEDGSMHKITLRKASYDEEGLKWLLSVDNKLVAILATQPEKGGIFSFLFNDPPDSDAKEWTAFEGRAEELKSAPSGPPDDRYRMVTGRHSFSHSWY